MDGPDPERLSNDLLRVRGLIAALVRRERTLLGLKVAVRGGLLLAVLLLLLPLAPLLRLDRSAAAALLVLVAGVGAWFLVAAPLLRWWGRAGDTLRQARLVEALAPELRGRLVTAVRRTQGPVGSESEALLGLVARRAVALASAVPGWRVHAARGFKRLVAGSVLLVLVSLVLSVLVPGGPLGTLRWWVGSGAAEAALARLQREADEPRARVGDLVLRYTYPAYTGLEPREVPNSTGDVSGPPGTVVEVVARSAHPLEAAAVVAYDDPPLEAEVLEGRQLQGRFTIQLEEGNWHFLTYRQGEATPSREFAITPEPDLPPEVMLEAESDVLEVALDDPIDLQWRARDDYGVRRVVLEVDGREVDPVLAAPRERRAEVHGQARITPRDLGLQQGDRVRLVVAAWDNDTVSGSKVGRSRAIEVLVLGPRGMAQRQDLRHRALRDKLLDLLADHLEDRWPPGATSGQVAGWGADWAERYGELDALVEELWGARTPFGVEAAILERVGRSGRELVRYTQVAFPARSGNRAPNDALDITGDMRDRAIVALEDGILALDFMIRGRAFRELAAQADRMAALAEDLQAALERNPDAHELLARLDHLERALAELMRQSADLQDGNLREFVNQRGDEMSNLLDEVREAIAEGRLDEARELMERLAQQMRDMSDFVQSEVERQNQQQGEGMDAAQDLQRELERLEQAQRDLQQEVRSLAEQQAGQEGADLWERVEQLAVAHAADARRYHEGVNEASRPFHEQQTAEHGAMRSRRLMESIQARDLRGSRVGVGQAQGAWDVVARQLNMARRAGTPIQGPDERHLQRLDRQLAEIEELLDELVRQSAQGSVEAAEQAQGLEERQRELEEELQQASEQAQQIARQFPMRPDGLEESLRDAGESMQQAGDDLRDGMPMPAEGAQGNAAERIADAREALQQAMDHARQMQQQMQGGQGQERQEGGQGEDGQSRHDGDQHHRVEIPSPEEFRTPEQYRRALLEGMEGEVPEQYRSMMRRYFEELVHQ